MAEWNLTEGRARGLVYGHVTQDTIDQILKHDRFEGLALSIEVGCIVTGVKIEDFVNHHAREAARDRTEWEARERRIEALAHRVSERGAFGRTGSR
jgi:hypothetical protein